MVYHSLRRGDSATHFTTNKPYSPQVGRLVHIDLFGKSDGALLANNVIADLSIAFHYHLYFSYIWIEASGIGATCYPRKKLEKVRSGNSPCLIRPFELGS